MNISFLTVFASRYLRLQNVNIVVDGNSLSTDYGGTANMDWVSQLETIKPVSDVPNTTHNLAISGQSTVEMLVDANSQLTSLYNSNVKNILVAWEIRNHLVKDAPTNQFAIDKMEEYCLLGKSIGYEVIVCSVLPSWAVSYRGDNTVTGYNLLQSDTAAVNTLLRNNYGDFADVLCDLAAQPSIGLWGNHESSGYVFDTDSRPTESVNGLFFDGTHLTDLGKKEVADLVAQSIWKLA